MLFSANISHFGFIRMQNVPYMQNKLQAHVSKNIQIIDCLTNRANTSGNSNLHHSHSRHSATTLEVVGAVTLFKLDLPFEQRGGHRHFTIFCRRSCCLFLFFSGCCAGKTRGFTRAAYRFGAGILDYSFSAPRHTLLQLDKTNKKLHSLKASCFKDRVVLSC